jgi:hypothetical protein
MAPGGALAGSLGPFLGIGAGRGIGLLLVVMGVLKIGVVLAGYFYPHVWRVEDELPDIAASSC